MAAHPRDYGLMLDAYQAARASAPVAAPVLQQALEALELFWVECVHGTRPVDFIKWEDTPKVRAAITSIRAALATKGMK